VIVGFFVDALRPTILNELDHFALARVLNGLKTLCSCVPGLAPRLFETSTAQNVSEARQRRRRGLERFLLGLSDQQLVTGLAVLTSGYMQRCSMTIYHFKLSLRSHGFLPPFTSQLLGRYANTSLRTPRYGIGESLGWLVY